MHFINGWTKEKVQAHLEDSFRGKAVMDIPEENRVDECRYRMADKKCVVGCFIPESHYQTTMEGKTAKTVIMDNNLSEFMPMSLDNMEFWQTIHDCLDEKAEVEDQISFLMNSLDHLTLG